MAKRVKVKRKIPDVVFLPDHLSQVKAIAMRGLSDDEMAGVFGIEPRLIQAWKKHYPTFKAAIEQGRTAADAQVVEALYKNAVGYSIEYDVPVKLKDGEGGEKVELVTVKKTIGGETQAQKYWLSNRQSDFWKDRASHEVGGRSDTPPIGVKHETKIELINSILNLIKPKEDPA